MTLRSFATKGRTGMTTPGSTPKRITPYWFTYVLECRDGSFYVGITNDLAARLAEHNAGTGASWTRKRRPVVMHYAEQHPGKSSARKREIEIKGWRRVKKIALFDSAKKVLCPASL